MTHYGDLRKCVKNRLRQNASFYGLALYSTYVLQDYAPCMIEDFLRNVGAAALYSKTI